MGSFKNDAVWDIFDEVLCKGCFARVCFPYSEEYVIGSYDGYFADDEEGCHLAVLAGGVVA